MADKQRRKLLKALSGGSAALVPAVWSSPIVQSVVVPAHAQATSCAIIAELPQSGIDEIALGIFD